MKSEIIVKIINEDGEACADAGNTGGMGGVVAAQPSLNAGTTIGSAFSGGGGTTGSGDISNPLNRNPYQKSPAGKKKKLNKFSKLFQLKQDYTKSGKRSKVMNYSDYTKDSMNKVTHLDNE